MGGLSPWLRWPLSHFLLQILVATPPTLVDAKNQHEHDRDLFHFKSRPNLKPPRWEMTIYDEEHVQPGYWFVAGKPSMEETLGSGEGWWGPAIYDTRGELIWASADQLDASNTMDFSPSQVLGELSLTMVDRDRGAGVVMDTHYEVQSMVVVHEEDFLANGHEWNFVDGGKSVLYLKNKHEELPDDERDDVGFDGDYCQIDLQEIHELDAKTWEPLFEWSPYGKIKVSESTLDDGDVEKKCEGWDYTHFNSIDKTPDGDYIVSGRHLDAIFKISKDDGHIVWRLNGKNSDFVMGPDAKFSRQHNIRCQGQNDTHMLVSMLDNAVGQDKQEPTHDFSRGLLLALRTDTDPMTAEVVQQFDHPREKFCDRRGNFQMLDNGNVYMGWSERAEMSEHLPNGTKLYEGRFLTDWIGSYRNYKIHNFTGRPTADPDVFSRASYWNEDREHEPTTHIYVSWNGDTRVAEWELHGVLDGEDEMKHLETGNRTGFETYFVRDAYLTRVQLKGLDEDGKEIADSGEIGTTMHPTIPDDEGEPVFDAADIQHNIPKRDHNSVVYIVLFLLGFLGAAFFILIQVGIVPCGWASQAGERGMERARRGAWSIFRYRRLSDDESLEDDDDEDDLEEQGQALVEQKTRIHRAALPEPEPEYYDQDTDG